MTVNDHVVRYQEHVSTKSYEELVAAFEEVAERHILLSSSGVTSTGPSEMARFSVGTRDVAAGSADDRRGFHPRAPG